MERSHTLGKKLSGSIKAWNFLTSWVTFSFSKRTLLYPDINWLVTTCLRNLTLSQKGSKKGSDRKMALWNVSLLSGYDNTPAKLKKKVKLSHCTPWRRLGDMNYSSYSFLTSALDEVSVQSYVPAAIYPREGAPSTHCIGGWLSPGDSLDAEDRKKIFCPCRGSNPCHPIRSQTLHYLSYPGSIFQQRKWKTPWKHQWSLWV
jgi:hypothetical protein